MIRTPLIALFLMGLFSVYGQESPVQWKFSLGESGETYAVLAEAEVADGWYVYSQFLTDGGPIPTSFDFSDMPSIKLVGKPTESGDEISGYDEYFGMHVSKYAKEVSFSQGIQVGPDADHVVGSIRFMACTSKKCLPPTNVDIALPLAR